MRLGLAQGRWVVVGVADVGEGVAGVVVIVVAEAVAVVVTVAVAVAAVGMTGCWRGVAVAFAFWSAGCTAHLRLLDRSCLILIEPAADRSTAGGAR